MASIFGLPTELLHEILLKLERECLKEFRCVCRESCVRVTPILFNRVYFEPFRLIRKRKPSPPLSEARIH
jgi:hypothetical protein